MNAWNPFDVPFPLLMPTATAGRQSRRRRDLALEDWPPPRWRGVSDAWRGVHLAMASGSEPGSIADPASVSAEPASVSADPGAGPAKVPFYKREIRLRRPRPAAPPAAEALGEPDAPEEPAPGRVLEQSPPAAESPDLTPALGVAGPDEVTEIASPAGDAPAPTSPAPAGAGRRRLRATPGTRSHRRSGAKGRKVVGLKIGTSQVAASVVMSGDAGPELLQLARRPIESGIVVDGEVRDAHALAAALKSLFDEHELPKRDVRIGLASNRIGVRMLEIVGISDQERFDNAVRFRAHEVLPVAVHESVLDYRVLSERENEAGELVRRVLLVVAPREQVVPYTDVARQAGLKLSGIDLEALALLRTFVEPAPFAIRAADDTATVVVAIGHESSTLLVAGGGFCEFTRVFDWGGRALQDAIAQELDVPAVEAATILRHLSLSGPGQRLESLDEVARAKALDAVRARLTPFTRELVSSLQYYQTQPDSLGIGEIVVTGGTSGLEGLADTLHQMIGVSVRVGDPLARVRVAAPLDPALLAAVGSLAVPIGLAIDDGAERQVDLLPRDLQVTRRTRPSLAAFAVPAAALVPVAALAVLTVGAQRTVSDRRAELQGVQAQIAALPPPRGPRVDPSIVGEEAARATAVASVLGGRIAWDGVFRDLSRILPGNVWLKQLTAKLPDTVAPTAATGAAPATPAAPASPPAAPTGVTIEGYTYGQPDVARLLARLAAVPSLTRVTLSSSQQEKLGARNVVRFVILADLSQTGAAR